MVKKYLNIRHQEKYKSGTLVEKEKVKKFLEENLDKISIEILEHIYYADNPEDISESFKFEIFLKK